MEYSTHDTPSFEYYSTPNTMSETLVMTRHVYLPLISRQTATLTKYLFVESWMDFYQSASCPRNIVEFPGYYFDPQEGRLIVYGGEPKLSEKDLGYWGDGLSGVGMFSYLTTFETLPVTHGVTLQSVAPDGTIVLTGTEGTIVLAPNGEWITQTVSIEGNEDCVVTRTRRITNYAFQDRSKITYRGVSLSPAKLKDSTTSLTD